MREFGLDETTLTEEEVAKRRQELKTLIKMGKTRGFLTHQEINDHLPEKLVDAEMLEAIVSMLNDMGIAVYEQAPDAATLLVAGGGADHRDRRRGRGGRRGGAVHGRLRVRPHHRPGAHVHARDGLGRAADARGRDRDRQAHRRRPAGDDAGHHRLADDDRRDPGLWPTRSPPARWRSPRSSTASSSDDEADDYVAEEDFDDFDEEDDDDGNGGSKALTKQLEELKVAALGQVRRAAQPASTSMRKAFEKDGYRLARLQQGAAGAQRRADDHPLHGQDDREAVRHPALAGRRRAPLRARDPQDRGRQVRHAAGTLHRALPAQRAEPEVGREGGRRRQALQRRAGAQPAGDAGAAAEADRPAGARRGSARRPEADQQADERGRAGLARRQEGDDRGQPAPGDLDRQEVHQPRPAVPRPDPGRQRRPDEGGRQVRIPPRLQVLDLRHVVDPPGHHALDRRPGAHHPHPGAHDRDDQQDEPHRRASTCRSSASSPTRRRWPRRWRCPRPRSARS